MGILVNLKSFFWPAIILLLSACSGGGSDEATTGGFCTAGISNLSLSTPVSNKSIATDESHCYRFSAVSGRRYQVTLNTHSGDSDVALFSDDSYISSSIINFSINVGLATDSISHVAGTSGSYYIEVFGFEGGRYSLTVVEEAIVGPGNTAPIAILPAQKQAALGQSILLDGGLSSDVDGDTLTYHWQLLSQPAVSGLVFAAQSGQKVSFDADIFGDYLFQLIVNDGTVNSIPANITVSVSHHFTGLDFRVTDAEYSAALELLVMVSADDNSLRTYNPVDRSMTSLSLAMAPTALSISPDGLSAAVGHDGWISIVDLVANTVLKTFAVTTDVLDLVLDGNGYVHAFPRTDQWERIRSIDIASELETLHSGNSIRAGTLARLHPDGVSIYGADNGLSPSDIEKYDISTGTANYLYDSPYHGDYTFCGELWIGEQGLRIYTACGNVFKSSPLQAEDMVYNGALENADGTVVSLSHTQEAQQVAAIFNKPLGPGFNSDSSIRFYEDSFLNETGTFVLPEFVIALNGHAAHGKKVFYNSDGSQYMAIVQADNSSGLLDDFAIVASPSNGDPIGVNKAPIANAGLNRAVVLPAVVDLDASASSDANGDSLTYAWRVIDAPAGSAAGLVNASSVAAQITPDLEGVYTIGLIVHDGLLFSNEDSISINAVNSISPFLLQLDYRISDAEYSDALDRIISVSASDKKLYSFDTANYQQTELALPLTPTTVGVSPDGLKAAVGHNGWITYVDLVSNSIIKTFAVTTDVFDIVLDAYGYVHAFPRIDQWERIRSVNLASEIESLHGGNSIRAGTYVRRHPDGNSIYGADNGLSPSDIEKYDISVSPVRYLSDSPYHGTYNFCGNLWITEDGLRIITRCGNAFRSSSDPLLDMTYNGKLENWTGSIASLNHSIEAGKIASIKTGSLTDTEIRFYNDDFLTEAGTAALPPFQTPGGDFVSHGKFVFYNSAGTRVFAVVQADSSSALLNDFGIAVQ